MMIMIDNSCMSIAVHLRRRIPSVALAKTTTIIDYIIIDISPIISIIESILF